jgi:hypothetical protein
MRTYTISEAAQVTGLSQKAIARRIERGSLRCVVRDGRRRIPLAELVRVGLLENDENPDEEEFDPRLLLSGGARPGGELPVRYDAGQTLAAVLRELFDRFERQATEIANFRALTVQAESLRLTSELADLRARIAELETQREPRALTSPRPAEAPSSSEPQRAPSSPPQTQELWLPSGAQSPAQPRPTRAQQRQPQAQLEDEIVRLRSHLTHLEEHRSPRRLGRATRLFMEAVFLAVVAVGVWYAELSTAVIFGLMTAAWIVVAIIEWVSWQRD